jgi:hypothetical protein
MGISQEVAIALPWVRREVGAILWVEEIEWDSKNKPGGY